MAQRGSLIQKLDEFIRAYYLNQLVNGALRSLAVLVCAGIGFALVEYIFFHFELWLKFEMLLILNLAIRLHSQFHLLLQKYFQVHRLMEKEPLR